MIYERNKPNTYFSFSIGEGKNEKLKIHFGAFFVSFALPAFHSLAPRFCNLAFSVPPLLLLLTACRCS